MVLYKVSYGLFFKHVSDISADCNATTQEDLTLMYAADFQPLRRQYLFIKPTVSTRPVSEFPLQVSADHQRQS